MPTSKGYSVQQLLEWSIEDQLIDGYERAGNRLIIFQGSQRTILSTDEAHAFLKRGFKSRTDGAARSPRSSSVSV